MLPYTFVLDPVMHRTPLLFMPVPQGTQGLTLLHLIRVHLHLIVVIMIPLLRGLLRAFSACARLQLMR
jgi:hypothetical protein